jgi:hypothetical protein
MLFKRAFKFLQCLLKSLVAQLAIVTFYPAFPIFGGTKFQFLSPANITVKNWRGRDLGQSRSNVASD